MTLLRSTPGEHVEVVDPAGTGVESEHARSHLPIVQALAGAPSGVPRRRSVARVGPPAALLAVVLGVWQLISSSLSNGQQFLLPPPWDVLTKGLLAQQAYSAILPAFGRTTELALAGLGVAVVLGFSTGAVLFRFRWLERAAYPYLVAIQAIPVLAVAPLMAVAFGYSFFAKGVIVVIIAFFPIPTSLLLGLKSVDPGMADLFQLHKVPWTTQFRKLALPASLPQLFTGLRISAGLAVIGAIVGEQFFQSGAPGLGMLLLQYLDNVDYNRLYGCIIVSSALGIVIYSLFNGLSHRLLGAWHESSRTSVQQTVRPSGRARERSSNASTSA